MNKRDTLQQCGVFLFYLDSANLYCAKAQRQQQIFTVRKRSDSNKSLLCESAATATNLYCAKAQRQQQIFTVRKRNDSNKCLLCESAATATNVFVPKGKRQIQNTSTSLSGEVNAFFPIQQVYKRLLK